MYEGDLYKEYKLIKMKNEDLIGIGFKAVPYFTIANSVTYDLGRNRHLSAGCVGTANEVLFICETDEKDSTVITDLVCLHNYDYDGMLTLEKVETLLSVLVKKV